MKFEKGDKVIPISKSIGKSFHDCDACTAIENGKAKYMTVVHSYDNDSYADLPGTVSYYTCSINNKLYFDFLEKDLIPYKEDNTMTKADLKSGMWVETSRSDLLMVLLNSENGDVVVGDCGWKSLDTYKDDLTCLNGPKGLDIVKVYEGRFGINYIKQDAGKRELLWERQPIEITKEEAFKTLREIYGCEVKITG